MTTESTSVPSSSGPLSTAGRPSVAPPRGSSDRLALPPRRRTLPARFAAGPLMAVDCLAILCAVALLPAAHHAPPLLVPLVVGVLLLDAQAGLHRPGGAPAAVLDELPALAARAAAAWCAAAAALAVLEPTRAIGPAALLTAYAIHLVVVTAGRAAVHGRTRRVAAARPRSALVVGPGGEAQRFAASLGQRPEYGIRPVGVVGLREDGMPPAADLPALPVLTTAEEIHRAVIQNSVREAVFLADDPALVTLFQHYGCATWQVGAGSGDTPMGEHLWGYACRRTTPLGERRGRSAKRLLDLAVAGPALAVAAPVLMLCALAVRLSDGPGVLFRQERVGQHGRLFTLLKFRTLRPADETESATKWSVANDARMSAVGNFLRRSSLDELPQLWNVLRGDMSLVGPRPERPYFVAQFSRIHAGYAARHRMPVGLTGLAQVHGLRGDTSIEDRCRFDNHYIDHWSLWQDVCILLRTAAGLVRPTGS
ncbi:sugar transferase [Streptomyces solicathayae]|uniref:Sugar transferase n=1 Tax=Streptomyces solicathayae TaxID=3081768 RepID=A0ABZ0LT78_9ACTN|nr:sugar transferase [Streptomyces sp. HUAS YS2]WOX22401.1 sugar transferase [Streptomyces sp. HUAS YS2]